MPPPFAQGRIMLDSNKEITLKGEEALEALAEIEYTLISLHKIGSYYFDKSLEDYRKATTDFIDNEKITQRLANVRKLISKNFDPTLGKDDMDDIERHLEGIKFWAPNKI